MPAGIDILTHKFTEKDRLLFDTNVWLSIQGPSQSQRLRSAVYSNAFKRALAAPSYLYIDVLVASEFVNTYARIRHQLLVNSLPAPPQFKAFRATPAFKTVAADIAADLQKILGHCEPIESGFAALNVAALVSDYAKGDRDFNDQVLAEACRVQGLTMVTDDADFAVYSIPVLSANPRLIR